MDCVLMVADKYCKGGRFESGEGKIKKDLIHMVLKPAGDGDVEEISFGPICRPVATRDNSFI